MLVPIIAVFSSIMVLLMFVVIYCSQKKANDDNPVYHFEKDHQLHVNVFYTDKSREKGHYKEFIFERTDKGYTLSTEEKKKFFRSMGFLFVYSLVISLIVLLVLYIRNGDFFPLAAIPCFIVLMAAFGFDEYLHYHRCVRYLKENRP